MLKVEDYEQIRRMYYINGKSQRDVARETGHSRRTVKQAVENAQPTGYRQKASRASPVLGPYQAALKALLEENAHLPRKQRRTVHKICEVLKTQGYRGAESTVNTYAWKWKQARNRPEVYLPLEYDAGMDAQVDWGEAEVDMLGEGQQYERVRVQLFVLRLCYSRRIFVRAYPNQRQEAFFDGHAQAFQHLGGVPRRITYDNLSTAVQRVLEGRNRTQQRAFTAFRSHYLFDARFCTPGEGHEKGGVEHGVGYARRNFLAGVPRVGGYADLNTLLLNECVRDEERQVHGQPLPIRSAWLQEKDCLLPLPAHTFECCATAEATLNGYSQVTYDTNRYSVPVAEAARHMVVKAYPFRVDVLKGEAVVASHPRCHDHDRDVFDPLHYLPLLEQRPGAFEHAKPIRQMRAQWPAVYEELLLRLQTALPGSGSVREFVRVLELLNTHPSDAVERAIADALRFGCAHADGVKLCLQQAHTPLASVSPLDLSGQPLLSAIARQPLHLQAYNQLLAGSHD